MIDEKEVRTWITRLECEESSWSNYEKLAVLYAIQNRHNETVKAVAPMMYSSAPAPVSVEPVRDYGDSDFLRAVSGKSPEKAWAVMDELMDALVVTNERVYNEVMRKVRNIE